MQAWRLWITQSRKQVMVRNVNLLNCGADKEVGSQTRTHNLQPMAPVLPFLSREQSCSLSLLVIELTCLSLGNSACVYKYRSLFLEMPCQYCFPLFSLEPYPRSPCALLSATIQFSIMLCSMWLLSLRAICHISGCSLVLTKASLCMH